jgi:FSR family fosmidomycin resistance protein-like MFS transporter
MAEAPAARQTFAPVADTFQAGQVLTIAGGHFVHDIFTSFLAPLLPLIIQKLGLSLTLAGTLAAFQQLPSLINPLLGMLADRGSLRWFVILAPTVTATAMSLIGVAPGYIVLTILLLVAGLSTAVWHTPTPAMAARVSGRQMGLGMSLFMLGGTTAYTIGPLLAVAAVSWWGLDGIW